MIQQISGRMANRSRSMSRQPGKPGWLATVVNLTGGNVRRLVPAKQRGRQSCRQVSNVVPLA